MGSIKMYLSAAMVLGAVALGATSAAAANWDPANTDLAGSGTMTFTTNSFFSFDCGITLRMRSTGNDVSTSVTPPVFGNCSSVTADTDWVATATSTTFVDLTTNFTITQSGGLCVKTLNAVVTNNTWSNTTHTLTFNPAVTFVITEHGFCDGGTIGHWSGTVTFPASAIIT